MRFIIYILLFTTVSISACKAPSSGQQIEKIIKETNQSFPLVHLVYLKTKADVSIPDLIKEIRKIEAISVLKNLEVGTFTELGDARAMSEFNIIMQMRFANKEDYQTYQKHPIHLALKKNVGPFLAGPPKTYDFISN